jgi:hypothetical protein
MRAGAERIRVRALGAAVIATALTFSAAAFGDEPTPPEQPAPPQPPVHVQAPNAEPVEDVAPRPTKEPIGTQRFLGALVGATGFITTAVGSFLVLSGVNLYHDAKDRCQVGGCTQTEVDDSNKSRSRADAGGWVFLSGLVLVGGGFALWFTAPETKKKDSGVSIGVAPGVGALSAVGTF